MRNDVNGMSKKELESRLNGLYEVANVSNGFNYWFAKLTNICMDIFNYEDLPKSLPKREIEIQLLMTGHCNVLINKGNIIAVRSELYGFDRYYQPTNYTYAQPVVGSGSKNIDGLDSCIIWNNSLQNNLYGIPIDGSLYTFIARYARQLADFESTINIYAVNTRKTDYPVAKNDKVKASLSKFFDKLKLGTHEIISDDNIIESFVDVPVPSSTRGNDNLINLLDGRDKILEQFFRDIGVKFRNPKKGNMISEEVESDEQVLIISLDDMLEARRKGIEEMNRKFGTSVKVDINEKFKRSKYTKSFVDETNKESFVDETRKESFVDET